MADLVERLRAYHDDDKLHTFDSILADAIEEAIDEIVDQRRMIEQLRERWEHFRKLESQAAEYVEGPIVLRTHFTGEEPYVGWKGVGLALSETLDRFDALKARIKAAPVLEMPSREFLINEGPDVVLRNAWPEKVGLAGKRVRLLVEE